MTVNVLITSVSRKVWLVRAFKDALKVSHVEGSVVGVDTNPLSAGLYKSDKRYLVPRSNDPSFVESVVDICRKEEISLLIPTRDDELLVFARNRRKFEQNGTRVMVSAPEVIEVCTDKYKFCQFLIKNGIPTPRTYIPSEFDFSSVSYPLIIKPRHGAGSRGLVKVENERDLNFFIGHMTEPLIQEFIEGKEYTIDLFADFDGNVLSIVPRERIEIFCGESFKGRTVDDPRLIDYSKGLAEKLGVVGHVTIQCIKSGEDAKFTELNPRFGGGAALGFEAGASTPLLLIKLILGEKIGNIIGRYRKNCVMLRYTEDIFIDIDDGKLVQDDKSRDF